MMKANSSVILQTMVDVLKRLPAESRRSLQATLDAWLQAILAGGLQGRSRNALL